MHNLWSDERLYIYIYILYSYIRYAYIYDFSWFGIVLLPRMLGVWSNYAYPQCIYPDCSRSADAG